MPRFQRQTGVTSPGRLILGIDPGLAIVGYAVLAEQAGVLQALACDVIRTEAWMPQPARLKILYEQITTLLATYRPGEAAIESLFFAKNKKTAMAVAQARGVLLLALSQAGLDIAEYTPAEVKQAVTGYGSASKAQVGEMVRILLHMKAVPRPDDAADAAAVAICHAHTIQNCK